MEKLGRTIANLNIQRFLGCSIVAILLAPQRDLADFVITLLMLFVGLTWATTPDRPNPTQEDMT